MPGFAVEGVLGVGGFGAVWEALDEREATHVAIKVAHAADAASVARLGREGDAMAAAGPSHAPALIGRGLLADGRPYLVMERLVGRLLSDEIEAWPGPPTLDVIRDYGGALLEGAAALAARGIMHRDLKPENLFLSRPDPGRLVAKLLDFGLSRGTSAEDGQRTAGEAGAGTPEYMAPEQIAGGETDLRTDVYALGLMLFELATLRLPFAGERRELEYGQLSLRPPRPSRFAPVAPVLEEVILRCLHKDPAARYPDAVVLLGAFREAIAQAAAAATGSVPTAGAPGGKKPAPRAGQKQKVALVFAQGERLSALDVQAAIQPFGGILAHIAPGLCACAVTYRAGENPGQRALSAAQALHAKGLARRLIIDVGSVTVKTRPEGPPRLISTLLMQPSRYPSAQGPEGIAISAAARDLLPEHAGNALPGRPDLFALITGTIDEPTRTTMQDASAPPLVGREEQIRSLVADVDRAIEERRPRVASVVGEAGLGKSRLAGDLARLLRTKVPSGQTIELRARQPLGSGSDETLADFLRRVLDLPAAAPPDEGRALLAEVLGERGHDSYAAIALVLGWIDAHHPAVQALRAAPGVLRASVARVGMEALRRLAGRAPVLVVLDDAHWADDALLDALEQATVFDIPLWVCALGRPVFSASRPGWGRRAAHVQSLALGPLDAGAAAALCRHLLLPATGVPEPVIARVVDRTQGVPLLMIDLVRGLRRQGLLRERGGGVWYVATEVLDRLPDSPLVEWLAERELDELPPELAAHARLVALLAPEISREEVEGVIAEMTADLAEAFPLDAAVALERLREARILVQHRSGRYSYRTGVMREAVALAVTEVLAAAIHRAALAHYRSANLPDGIRLPRLAWHAAHAGERQEAATTYLAVAEDSRERHNFLEADLNYTRALDQIDDSQADLQLRACKGRGIMRYRLNRHDGSLADLARAGELAGRTGDALLEADVLLDEAMALDWLLEWRRSRELAERARALVAAHPSPSLEARALLAVGRSCMRFSEEREAVELLRQASRAAEQMGDEGYEVFVISEMLLGFLLPFLNLLGEAEERLDRVAALCADKGDELHLAGVLGNRACLWIAKNDRPRFMADVNDYLAYGRRMGNPFIESRGNLNSAYFLYWRGEFREAIPFARQAIEVDEKYFRQGGFRPDAAVLLARILWGAGDEAGARKLVEEVRAHQSAARAAMQNELLLQPNDEMLLDMITLVLEKGDAARWEALMKRARAVAQGQELIEALEVAGVAALDCGDAEAARGWWQEALATCERMPNVMGERIRQRMSALA